MSRCCVGAWGHDQIRQRQRRHGGHRPPNACGLSEKRSRSLLAAGVTRLAISFDSPVKETYEKIRIGANFDKTLANIRRFVALRDELGYELPTVRVQMVKQEMNVGQVEMFDELFSEFVDSTSHVDYVNYNGGPNAYVDQDVIDGDNMSHTLRVLNPDFICKYLWQRLIIQWDGKCYPCFYGFDLVVGDLNDQSLDRFGTAKRCRICANSFDWEV